MANSSERTRFSDLYDIVKKYIPDTLLVFQAVTGDQFERMDIHDPDPRTLLDPHIDLVDELLTFGVPPAAIRFCYGKEMILSGGVFMKCDAAIVIYYHNLH